MLKKEDLNVQIKSVIVSGFGGVIWLIVNPASDILYYKLVIKEENFCSKDLDTIIKKYNDRLKK